LCAAGECSWYEFASSILATADVCGLIERRPDIVPIAAADYPTRARRPAYSVLDTTKFRTTFGLHLPGWESGADAVLEELVGAHRDAQRQAHGKV
jgi:dTDP-4-dehydrorhamnose reductase